MVQIPSGSPKITKSAQSPAVQSPLAPSIKSPVGRSRPSGRLEGVQPVDFKGTVTDDAGSTPNKPFKSTQTMAPSYPSSGYAMPSGQPVPTYYSGGVAPGVAHPPSGWFLVHHPSGAITAHPSGPGVSGAQPPHTYFSGGCAPGCARAPDGWVFSGPSQTWQPHAASAHLSRGAEIMARIPPMMYDSIARCAYTYQPLSRWTTAGLANGKLIAEGLADEDMTLSSADWIDASNNLLAGLSTVAPATANVFSLHFSAIKERLVPPFWPALRTYDLRIRLGHTGRAAELVAFDTELFASILMEDHQAAYAPLDSNENSSEDEDGFTELGKVDELKTFLEGVREGLGQYAAAFFDAGVMTHKDLKELDDAFDDVVDHMAQLSVKDKSVLKSLVKQCPIFQEKESETA